MARYDYRLTGAEFYHLTPRQFHLLSKCHRESLAHREMVGGHTTAAVINSGFCRPEEPVSALEFMPNHSGFTAAPPPLTEEELAAESEYNLRVLRRSMELKRNAATVSSAEGTPRRPQRRTFPGSGAKRAPRARKHRPGPGGAELSSKD